MTITTSQPLHSYWWQCPECGERSEDYTLAEPMACYHCRSQGRIVAKRLTRAVDFDGVVPSYTAVNRKEPKP